MGIWYHHQTIQIGVLTVIQKLFEYNTVEKCVALNSLYMKNYYLNVCFS